MSIKDRIVSVIHRVRRHKEKKTIHEFWIDPTHVERTESSEYRKNREKLMKEQGECYICGTKDNLQAHHWAEWSEFNFVDKDKLKSFLMVLDPYGYSNALKDYPVKTPDDLRNLVVLCRQHHIEKYHGIHETTFPIWILQKIKKDGIEVVGNEKVKKRH